jgi:hypothetical protein
MSARWAAQATPPGSVGRVGGAAASLNPEVQAIVRLVKSDADFRNELKNVIAEALQPDLEKLKQELLGQMSANNVAAATSHVPPPLDHDAIIQRDFPGATLEDWSHHDEQGSVYGFAETVSSHIIRHNNMAYLCDIKDSIDISDVVFLIRIGKLYKSLNPSSALACVLICRYISPRAKILADKCKMKTILAP